MKEKRHPVKAYVLFGLLSCLIIKLAFNMVFLTFNDGEIQLSWFGEGSALAKNEKDEQEEKEKKKDNTENTSKTNNTPDITEIQQQIGALQNQIQSINKSINDYSKKMPRATSLNPETLEKKRLKIEKERLELDAERERLSVLKNEIDGKIVKLGKIQAAIRSELEKKKAVQDGRIKHLIKIYTTMPAKKAAALIEKLEMDVIMALFSGMKGENVGQILPYVSPEKAAQISERLVKLNM